MKRILFLLVALFTMGFSATAADAVDSVKVWGNCGMCQARIEKAAKDAGATSAMWSEDTKMLTVSFDGKATSLKAIEQKVAAVGHDTENNAAPKNVYSKLPGCCKYERKPGVEK